MDMAIGFVVIDVKDLLAMRILAFSVLW